MPVCPHCGHDTPDPDARFCAACGRSLAPDAPGGSESAAEATSVLHLGSESTEAAESTEASDPAEASDAAVIERLQSGTALLVVRRDRRRARASCWTLTSLPQGVIPTATSFSTTSLSRATMLGSLEKDRPSISATLAV